MASFLALALFGVRGTPTAEASISDEWFGSEVACWATGMLGSNPVVNHFAFTPDNSWGSEFEFIVDYRDMGDDLGNLQGRGFEPDKPLRKAYQDGLLTRFGGGVREGILFVGGQAAHGVVEGLPERWNNGKLFTGTFGVETFVSGLLYDGLASGSEGAVQYVRGVSVPLGQDATRAMGDSVLDLLGGPVGRPLSWARNAAGSIKGLVVQDKAELDVPFPASTTVSTAGLGTLTPSLFGSFPEAVDYTFYADIVTELSFVTGVVGDNAIPDYRLFHMERMIDSDRDANAYSHGDNVPWSNQEEYLKRRAVGQIATDRVSKYSAHWLNRSNPQGGLSFDHIASSVDRRAMDAELRVAERVTAQEGNRVLTGVGSTEALQVISNIEFNCVGTNCNGDISSNTVPTTVLTNTSTVDVNNQEVDRTDYVPGRKTVPVRNSSGVEEFAQVDILPDTFKASTADYREAQAGGYGALYIFDGEDDEIQINLELNSEFRKDYTFYGGGFLKDLFLPALGVGDSVWTYDLINLGRRDEHNVGPTRGLPTLATVTPAEKHMGYRQPSLSRAYLCATWSPSNPIACGSTSPSSPVGLVSDSLTPDNTRHIRWPVNFEDLNWYLYQLPGSGPSDSEWLLWVHKFGRRLLVHSGYGLTAATDFLPCEVAGTRDEVVYRADMPDPDLTRDKPLVSSANISCFMDDPVVNPGALPLDKSSFDSTVGVATLANGEADDVYFPFDVRSPPGSLSPVFPSPGDPRARLSIVPGAGGLLREGTIPVDGSMPSGFTLVKAGVESPVDAHQPVGTRDLNHFSFSIKELDRMSGGDVQQMGGLVLKRHGVPNDGSARADYLNGWPQGPIDPNRPYLLVVTFYESLDPTYAGEETLYRGFKVTGDQTGVGDSFRLPKRHIRRVVCRLMVLPPGFSSEAEEQTGILRNTWETLSALLSEDFKQLSSWLASILRSASTAHLSLVQRGGEVACKGMVKLDELTALDSSSVTGVQTRVGPGGVLAVNEVSRSRNEGIDQCERVATPAKPVCNSNIDLVAFGKCFSLPKMRLVIRGVEFVEPPSEVRYREYGNGGRVRYAGFDGGEEGWVTVPFDLEGNEFGLDPGRDPYFEEPLAPGYTDPVTSKNVGLTRVNLDWEFLSTGISEDVYNAIDGYVVYVYPDEKSSPLSPGEPMRFVLPRWVVEYKEDEVSSTFGSIARHSVEGFSVGGMNVYPADRLGSNSLVTVVDNHLRGYTVASRPPSGPSEIFPVYWALGDDSLRDSYDDFIQHVGNMPLAPGFVHEFKVAPYIGQPGVSGSFREGPPSDILVLDGNRTACMVENTATGHVPPHLRELYDCDALDSTADLGYADQGFRVGLLSLTGSNICRDIFSSTPAAFTWDNGIVRQVWGLMWIIAGGVLFSLLVWQGLRMTYDIWLDPQPVVGFRELIPRFLLAVALAAGSLVLCQLILVVASDLTCFVAQMTGMSMWGVIGTTFGTIMSGFLTWAEGVINFSLDAPFLELTRIALLLLAGGLVVIILLLAVLYMFLKVALGMLLRIALLAVLIAVSPLAFAFYASDSTSHWTKQWVSMFLGATFQQALVLIVVYIGGHLLGYYLGQAEENSFTVLVIGLMLGFVTLALADKVPMIVNPAGRGLFAGIGDMGRMAAAGTLMAASVGTGAVVGGLFGGLGGGGQSPPAAPGAAPGGGPSRGPGPGTPGVTLGIPGPGTGGSAPSSLGPAQGDRDTDSGFISGIRGTTFEGASGEDARSPRSGIPAWIPPSGDVRPAEVGETVEAEEPGGEAPGTGDVRLPGDGAERPSGGRPGTGPGVAPEVSSVSGTGAPGGGEDAPPVTVRSGGGPSGDGRDDDLGAYRPVEVSPEQEAAEGGQEGGRSRGSRAGDVAGGLGRYLASIPRNAVEGARSGVRFAGGVNTRMDDMVSGNWLYRHSSRADDSAAMQERALEARREEGALNRQAYTRLSEIMERMERRLGGESFQQGS